MKFYENPMKSICEIKATLKNIKHLNHEKQTQQEDNGSRNLILMEIYMFKLLKREISLSITQKLYLMG